MHEWVVTNDQAGHKLLAFLCDHLDSFYSARHLKRLIDHNLCLINGKTERFARTILAAGDHVMLLLESSLPAQEPLSIDYSRILYEDEDILVYDKPSRLNSDEKGILKILHSYHPTLQLVHRLDRNTTGVLLLAKNQAAYLNFVEQFRNFLVKKCYRTIVDGNLREKEGWIDNYLGKKKIYAGQTIWGKVKAGGLHAQTAWKKIKETTHATLLYCFPKTGRTHQIRVHMAEIGHPILGDFQYAKVFKCPLRPPYYLLHAEKTIFLHPISGKKMIIKAPLPVDFRSAQNQLFGIV